MSLDCAGGSGAARQRRAHAAHCGIRRERVRALATSDIAQGHELRSCSSTSLLHLLVKHSFARTTMSERIFAFILHASSLRVQQSCNRRPRAAECVVHFQVLGHGGPHKQAVQSAAGRDVRAAVRGEGLPDAGGEGASPFLAALTHTPTLCTERRRPPAAPPRTMPCWCMAERQAYASCVAVELALEHQACARCVQSGLRTIIQEC